ncbi:MULTISPECIES: hypothetical protein [unclassified Rhizobium]|uniref:hypothetical protein n=1 Tax=unclassified Rhizobium TaxID=2613769 RepID=UPI0024783EF0|nr:MULTISPECIES: hypothetical protein [unclassified Rhizobium]MDH7803334.1 hypothetical protein [Rhizobium sp. AN70]
MTSDNIQYFAATLYFDDLPALSAAALIEAWGREGYECEQLEAEVVFDGFRGGTRVLVGNPEPVGTPAVLTHYPAAALAEVDWTNTFYVNAKAGYDDLRRASHQAKFKLMIMADEDDPTVAHNEIAMTLLGIHQVAPMRAVVLHYLDLIVGRTDLDDYLSYANSHLDQPQQTATMLAYGAFVTRENGTISAWTTGLEHFGQTNLLFDTSTGNTTEALLTVFGLGHLVVHGKRFEAGEAITSYDLLARFEPTELDGKPMLRIVKYDPAKLP